ncbi:MAG TPA: hypothetical protein VF310_08185 [Vicinamibacteria bacterium]
MTVGPGGPRLVALRLDVAAVAETITVNGEAPLLDMRSAASGATFRSDDRLETGAGRKSAEPAPQLPSQNVVNLQRRVAGVLPVRLDVPRAGTAYHFLRPLVLDEETKVSFRYKAR